MKIVPHDEIINIPPEVAVCPYCGGKLTVQLETWVQLDDGLWGAPTDETPHVECEFEPDMLQGDDYDDSDADDWEAWYESHSAMPYVYLMPVEIKVARWLNANYRFDMEVTRV